MKMVNMTIANLQNNVREFVLSHRTFLPLMGALLVCLSLVCFVAFTAVGATEDTDQSATAASAYDPFAGISITAQAAIVFDEREDKVLYEKNADVPLPLASITKLMLILVANEYLAPDTSVIISEQAIAQDGESGLIAGDVWRARDLMDFTLIVSSNDGAEALAEAAGSRIRAHYPEAPADNATATIWRMNAKAKELGLTQTYYLDAHGLDESTSMAGAYGSVRDMATLFAYAASHALDAISATTYQHTDLGKNHGSSLPADNTNDALGTIPGLIAGKTGYTDLAGGNLGIVFDAGMGRPIVVVVLGATEDSRFTDVQTLSRLARQAIAIPK